MGLHNSGARAIGKFCRDREFIVSTNLDSDEKKDPRDLGRHNNDIILYYHNDSNFIFYKITCDYRMASGSGGRNPEWRYCTYVEGNKNGTICNYCGLMIKSGGITCFKFHPSHMNPHSNTKKCLNVPPEVKQEMKQLLEQKSKAKSKKATYMEEIRAEL